MIFKTFALAFVLASSSAVDRDCVPSHGFQLGLAGADRPEACSQRAYRIDFELGRTIRRLRDEQSALQENLKAQHDESMRRQISRRLQTIERELHQLEGLARIRDLSPRQP